MISPRNGLNPEVSHRVDRNQVEYFDRTFTPSDLDDSSISMVLVAIDDPEASTQIWKLCKEKRIPANIADVPPECDFYFGSVHRDGPLQIMVSTNGNGPKMAALLRQRIATSLPPKIGDAIAKVGELRKRLRMVAPKSEESPKRMQWYVHNKLFLPRGDRPRCADTHARMSKVCVEWSLEDLCEMNEIDMDELLKSYAPDQVPTFEQIRLGENPGTFDFDGSFGWACVI